MKDNASWRESIGDACCQGCRRALGRISERTMRYRGNIHDIGVPVLILAGRHIDLNMTIIPWRGRSTSTLRIGNGWSYKQR